MYDLGACDGPGHVPEFVLQRPASGGPRQPRPLGYPAEAVAADRCELCGPYLLLERCRSEGGAAHGAGGCARSWRAAPGWTNMPMQYIGDAAVEGRVPGQGATRDLVEELAGWFRPDVSAMSGLGKATGHGVCGSYVVDGPSRKSLFYLRRA